MLKSRQSISNSWIPLANEVFYKEFRYTHHRTYNECDVFCISHLYFVRFILINVLVYVICTPWTTPSTLAAIMIAAPAEPMGFTRTRLLLHAIYVHRIVCVTRSVIHALKTNLFPRFRLLFVHSSASSTRRVWINESVICTFVPWLSNWKAYNRTNMSEHIIFLRPWLHCSIILPSLR